MLLSFVLVHLILGCLWGLCKQTLRARGDILKPYFSFVDCFHLTQVQERTTLAARGVHWVQPQQTHIHVCTHTQHTQTLRLLFDHRNCCRYLETPRESSEDSNSQLSLSVEFNDISSLQRLRRLSRCHLDYRERGLGIILNWVGSVWENSALSSINSNSPMLWDVG